MIMVSIIDFSCSSKYNQFSLYSTVILALLVTCVIITIIKICSRVDGKLHQQSEAINVHGDCLSSQRPVGYEPLVKTPCKRIICFCFKTSGPLFGNPYDAMIRIIVYLDQFGAPDFGNPHTGGTWAPC